MAYWIVAAVLQEPGQVVGSPVEGSPGEGTRAVEAAGIQLMYEHQTVSVVIKWKA